jgi:hypothetical protein
MSHDLSPELARKVAERAFDAYREKYASYDPKLTWQTPDSASVSFSAKGVSLKGKVELSPGKITFELDVPFVLRLFQSKAIAVIERELAYWRDKAKSGELS